MDIKKTSKNGAAGELVTLRAGFFSSWLQDTEALLLSGKGEAQVPCGACTACCRASMFIHIQPEEKQTIARIPRALLFPAPGWPKGHMLMGYSDKGRCPMLVDDKCSIYEDRPQTCRTYDCRVLAAAGMALHEAIEPDIANRVKAWVFEYESDRSREEHATLQAAAAFLQKHRDLFPPGILPSQPAPLAAFAIKIYRLFSKLMASTERGMSDAAIAQAIMAAIAEPERDANARL
jgi:Fe-S-cluster containining protein